MHARWQGFNSAPATIGGAQGSGAKQLDKPQSSVRAPALVPALLAVGLVGLAALQVQWILRTLRPPDWDPAWYLEHAIRFHRTLVEDGWGAFLEAVRASFGIKAPGLSLVAVLPLAIGGGSADAAVMVNVALWGLGGIYVYRLARSWLAPPAAAVGALASLLMPLSFALARSFFVETALSTAVVAFLFHAEASDRMRRPLHVVAMGLWGALGLLLKVSFPAYVALPALLLWLVPWSAARERLSRIAAGSAAVVALAVGTAAFVWYARNWRNVLTFAGSSGFGSISQDYGTPLGVYLQTVALHGASPWLLALLATIGGSALSRGSGRALGRRAAFLAAWIAPFLLMLAAPNKDARYIAPLLPALALALASLLERHLGRGSPARGAFVAAIALGPPLLVFLGSTLGRPLPSFDPFPPGPFWYEGPPDARHFPHREILQAIEAGDRGGAAPRLLLNLNTPFYNHNNFLLEALEVRSRVRVGHVERFGRDAALQSAAAADYLLTAPDGAVREDFLNRMNSEVNAALRAGDLPMRKIRSFPTPDGWALDLYVRTCRAPAAPRALVARFDEGVSLEALEAAPVPGGISVRTLWTASRPIARALVLFVHAVDASGRIRANLDHRPCASARGAPDGWPVGEPLADEFFVPSSLAPGLELRLGLYDASTGERLRILETRSAVGTDDQDTRLVLTGAIRGAAP